MSQQHKLEAMKTKNENTSFIIALPDLPPGPGGDVKNQKIRHSKNET